MQDKAAHTAEHAFIGSLQRLLGQTIEVRKVEHRTSGTSTAYIVIPSLSQETVVAAEKMTNSLITQGRKIRVHEFDSLERARASFRSLRANEARISGAVRIVEIQDHDVAACSMEHVSELSECEFFLITKVSRTRSEYEVDFVTGNYAKQAAVEVSSKLLEVCNVLGANLNTLISTVGKLKTVNNELNHRLKSLTERALSSISPKIIHGKHGEVVLFSASFADLSDDQILEFAGTKIEQENTLVCISNSSGREARVIFARSVSGSMNPDMNEFFRRHAGNRGKGGGKPHFVTGIVDSGGANAFVQAVESEFQSQS